MISKTKQEKKDSVVYDFIKFEVKNETIAIEHKYNKNLRNIHTQQSVE
jgi:hypothetical protein